MLVFKTFHSESVAKVQTTTAAYFETTTVRESAKNMTIGKSSLCNIIFPIFIS